MAGKRRVCRGGQQRDARFGQRARRYAAFGAGNAAAGAGAAACGQSQAVFPSPRRRCGEPVCRHVAPVAGTRLAGLRAVCGGESQSAKPFAVEQRQRHAVYRIRRQNMGMAARQTGGRHAFCRQRHAAAAHPRQPRHRAKTRCRNAGRGRRAVCRRIQNRRRSGKQSHEHHWHAGHVCALAVGVPQRARVLAGATAGGGHAHGAGGGVGGVRRSAYFDDCDWHEFGRHAGGFSAALACAFGFQAA